MACTAGSSISIFSVELSPDFIKGVLRALFLYTVVPSGFRDGRSHSPLSGRRAPQCSIREPLVLVASRLISTTEPCGAGFNVTLSSELASRVNLPTRPGEARPVEAAMARGARRLRRETARVVVAAGRRRPRRRAAGGSSAGEGEAGRAWTPRPSAHRSAAAAAAENPLICTNIKQLDRKGSMGWMDGWIRLPGSGWISLLPISKINKNENA